MRNIMFVLIFLCVGYEITSGQYSLISEEKEKKAMLSPQPMDFSKTLEQKQLPRDEYENIKRQQEIKLTEQFAPKEAAERAVDPVQYKVGPNDVFSLNIWGALEMQIPLTVTPEGKLLIPSVGEIPVDGFSLAEVQERVVERSKPFYEKSKITLTLAKMRLFRVHVVGEVVYPGTYVSQAVYRVSEMIYAAGGLTGWAWNRAIELRHLDGRIDTVDMSLFEQEGKIENDPFVNGSDVIYAPHVALNGNTVQIEGNQESTGIYQIGSNETLLGFLQRIRTLTKNTDFSKITVIRSEDVNKTSQWIKPFVVNKNEVFFLKNGDRIVLPSKYVYVRGAVQKPGAYPFLINQMVKDYAGMAGVVGNINSAKVYHVENRRTQKGPHRVVEPGDVIDVPNTWSQRLTNMLSIASTIASMAIAAKAVGL